MKSKYIGFLTPKCFANLEKSKIPEHLSDVELVPTVDVYMNLLDPDWTEEMCDNRIYFVERESFEKNTLRFKL